MTPSSSSRTADPASAACRRRSWGPLALARAVGIATPHAWLVDAATIEGLERWAERVPGLALAVSRFDRLGPDRRVHMEEIAQIRDLPTHRADAKYRYGNLESVAVIVGALAGPEAVDEVVSRIVLNVLTGNGDAHLKNWAVTYPGGVGPALSPVYDIVPTVLYVSDDDLGLNLAGSKDFVWVTPGSFDRMAARAALQAGRTRRVAQETAERVRERWSLLADHLTAEAYTRLTRRLDTLTLAAPFA